MSGISLTPRQARLTLDVVTVAMVVSVAFALAGLTWRIAGHAGTGAITVPSGKSAPAGAAQLAPAIALAPFGKPTVSDMGQPTGLPLELKGLIAADPASMSTAFIAMSGQPALPFHIGDNVGGATIQGITRDRVILSNGGRTEYLGFPDPTLTPAPGASPAVPGAAPPVAAPAPAPPPAAGIGDIPGLAQRFGATPADGGYRVGAGAPAGLSQGDLIQSINGTQLSDPQAASAAIAGAQQAGSATIVVLRNGKRLTLTVPIR